MGPESTTMIRRRRWKWRIMVMSFLFPLFLHFSVRRSDWPNLETPLTDTIDVMVERMSCSNLFFPFVSPFDFSLSLSDVLLNFLQRWADLGGSDATDSPSGEPCHSCPSLTLVYVHLCASLIFSFRCRRWCSLCLSCRYYQVFYNVSILPLCHHLACGDHLPFAQYGIT
jgi:hypothetical protein